MGPVLNWAPFGVFIKLDADSLGYGHGLKPPAEPKLPDTLSRAWQAPKYTCQMRLWTCSTGNASRQVIAIGVVHKLDTDGSLKPAVPSHTRG